MSLKQKRLAMLWVAIPLMGVGVGLFMRAGLGSDPYTSFGLAMAAKTGIGFGTMTLIDNLVLLILVLCFYRQALGIGTVVNMVGVGYLVDLFLWCYDRFFAAPGTLFGRLLLMMAGVLILSFAASLYFTAALGLAPYDTLAFMLQKVIRCEFVWCRILSDGTALVVALLLGGSAGIGTVVCACGLGPFITFFNHKVSIPLLGATPLVQKADETDQRS